MLLVSGEGLLHACISSILYILVKCNLASFLMMTETAFLMKSKARLLKCLFSELPLFCISHKSVEILSKDVLSAKLKSGCIAKICKLTAEAL